MYVLLADDHELVRSGLRFYLQRLAQDVTVIEAAKFDDALGVASTSLSLDLIILDLKMPGMNGFAGLDVMCERFPEVPVVILSGFVAQEEIMTALSRGAAGYLPKTLTGKAMLNALDLVLSGETYVPSAVFKNGFSFVGQADVLERERPDVDGPLTRLTAREREILGLLMEGKSNKMIARDLGIQEITVKVHLSHVFTKLGASNRTQAVRIAMDQGLRA